jgi:CDGSH-type Zn-finger protein
VVSEDGDPLTWQTIERLPRSTPFALCRCGGSADKPFCDGTHARTGFVAEQRASTTAYSERRRGYAATGIVVYDDRSICEHAGFCGNRVSNIWKMAKDGSLDDSVVRAQAIAMIEHCPSGALTFALADGGAAVEPELRTQVSVIDDGPLFVSGGVQVELPGGEPLEVRNRMTLCRCGQSQNKPLCDGTHKEVGFSDRGPNP